MNDITDLMRRATDDLDTDTVAVVRRGIARGTRLRRRRTVATGLAAVSALALTGAATVALQQVGTPGADAGTPAAGNPTSSVAQPSKPATSRDTLATLRAVLPKGLRVTEPRHWDNNPSWTGASVIVDDGHGAAKVEAEVVRGGFRQCQPDTTTTHCEVLPDGSLVVTRSHPVYPSKPNGVLTNGVELHRRDGVMILLRNYNARDEKGVPKTRPQPPLSLTALTAMARSELWRPSAPYTPPPGSPKR